MPLTDSPIRETLQKAVAVLRNKGSAPINTNISHFTNVMSLSGIYGAYSRAWSYNFVMTSLHDKLLTTELFIKPLTAIVVSLCFIKSSTEVSLFQAFLVLYYCMYMLITIWEWKTLKVFHLCLCNSYIYIYVFFINIVFLISVRKMTIYYRNSLTVKGKVMVYITVFLLNVFSIWKLFNTDCIYTYFICACASIHTFKYINPIACNRSATAKKVKPSLAKKGSTYILTEILKPNRFYYFATLIKWRRVKYGPTKVHGKAPTVFKGIWISPGVFSQRELPVISASWRSS